jgi:hypothetical protein
VADEADDIARPGFVHRLAFAAEELVGGGEADGLAGALVRDDHVAVELARADAAERDAVAVLGVHVRLDLEDEAGEFRGIDRDDTFLRSGGGLAAVGAQRGRSASRSDGDRDRATGLRRHRVLEETVEQELDAEIVHGAAEVDGRLLAGLHGLEIERVAGAVEHRELVLHLAEGVVVELAAHGVVIEGGDVDRGLELAARDALEEVDFLGTAIEDALEGRTVAEGPDDRRGLEAEDVLKFVEEVDRALRVGRSHLFMNVKMGTPRRRQTSKSLRVCVSTPLAASMTMRAASTAVSTR